MGTALAVGDCRALIPATVVRFVSPSDLDCVEFQDGAFLPLWHVFANLQSFKSHAKGKEKNKLYFSIGWAEIYLTNPN
jgi:hypothetical protein